MRRTACIIPIFLFTVILYRPGGVSADTFKVDPNYSSVMFRIRHTIGHVNGFFKKFDGVITLNRNNTLPEHVEATIEAASIDTNNKQRDEDLRSERFLDASQYPQLMFKMKKAEEGHVIGDLTLHGVTKEVKLAYHIWGIAKDQYGQEKLAVSLGGVVNRRDFGIVFNEKTDDGQWLIGDDVQIIIEAQGILEKKKYEWRR